MIVLYLIGVIPFIWLCEYIHDRIWGYEVSETWCGYGWYWVVHSKKGGFYRRGPHPRAGVG